MKDLKSDYENCVRSVKEGLNTAYGYRCLGIAAGKYALSANEEGLRVLLLERAAEAFEQSSELEPKDYLTLEAHCSLLESLGEFEAITHCAVSFLESWPKSPLGMPDYYNPPPGEEAQMSEGFYQMARGLDCMGREKDAQEIYLVAISASSTHIEEKLERDRYAKVSRYGHHIALGGIFSEGKLVGNSSANLFMICAKAR